MPLFVDPLSTCTKDWAKNRAPNKPACYNRRKQRSYGIAEATLLNFWEPRHNIVSGFHKLVPRSITFPACPLRKGVSEISVRRFRVNG